MNEKVKNTSQGVNFDPLLSKKTSSHDVYDSCSFALMTKEQLSYEEAQDKEEQINIMKEHIDVIERNETWELVDLTISCDAIGVKWINGLKYNPNGSAKKHKASFVAKGYAQYYGVDYFETFFPIARFETGRMLLFIAAQMEWKVYQFDVNSALLNGY